MKIYISGPITGLDHQTAFANFERAEKMLRDLGFDPVNPMKHSGLDANGGKDADGVAYSWEEYMKADIALLLGCDAIYLLNGWEASRGATLELNIAQPLKIKLIFAPSPPKSSDGDRCEKCNKLLTLSEAFICQDCYKVANNINSVSGTGIKSAARV